MLKPDLSNKSIVKASLYLPEFKPNPDESNVLRKELEIKLYEKVKAYNAKKAINHALLEEIIALCDQYITSIPIKNRPKTRDNLNNEDKKNDFVVASPNTNHIFHLQQQAVVNLFTPETKEAKISLLAKSRWTLISNLINSHNPDKKLLDENYWAEHRYQGKCHFLIWAYSIPFPFQPDEITSLSEVISKEEKSNRLAVFYLPKNETNKLIVTYDEKCDVLKDKKGTLLNGFGKYVMTSTGILYFLPTSTTLPAMSRHSSLLAGNPVLCAGDMELKNGKIVHISNRSGHYKPSKENFAAALKILIKNRIDLSKTEIGICSGLAIIKTLNSYQEFLDDLTPAPNRSQIFISPTNK